MPFRKKSVRPVGASEEEPTDIRLLSATHKDLAREVETGNFREDLYYRINVIDVQVPSLRERIQDLPTLTTNILTRISGGENKKSLSLDASAINALSNYHFPGNVRELENILERASALSDGEVIRADDLQFLATNTAQPTAGSGPVSENPSRNIHEAYGDLEGYLEDIEREVISAALEECKWNKTATSKLLGISFRSLRYRLKKLDLED